MPFGESIAFARAIEKILVERITNHCVDAISSLDNGSDDEWGSRNTSSNRTTMYTMTMTEECGEILVKKEKMNDVFY